MADGARLVAAADRAIVASVPLDGLRVTREQAQLSFYQFNTMTAEHYFCSICGIYTRHRRRSNRNQYGSNGLSGGRESFRAWRNSDRRWHQSSLRPLGSMSDEERGNGGGAVRSCPAGFHGQD
jgi:hypothetical protein